MQFDGFGRQTGGSRSLVSAVHLSEGNNELLRVRDDFQRISSGVLLSPSIDNYLHAHSENSARVKIGKLLIAKALFEAERDSSLFFNPDNIYDRFDFSKVSNTWLSVLFRTLVTVGDLESLRGQLRNITFISFNYDRVIHRFFFLAVQTLFDLSESEAEEFCFENLSIYYPYGSLGTLQSRNRDSGFGLQGEASSILAASESIKVFTEKGNQATQKKVRQRIVDADTVFFVGFSFLSLNMNYLSPRIQSNLRVFGTTYGMSEFNKSIAENNIAIWINNGQSYKPTFTLPSVTCAQLLSDLSGFFEQD